MECKICFENYDHSIHKPNVLIPCSHTLCIGCLLKLKLSKTCPVCKCEFTGNNPNRNLHDLVPESDYDRARKSLQESFNQGIHLTSTLKEKHTKQLKDLELNFKSFKSQIQAKTIEIIKIIYKQQRQLLDQVKLF